MTEATVVRNIIARVKKDLSRAVVFKHADRVTAGVPDISVTVDGRTTWFEVKFADFVPDLRKKLNRLQLATLRLLEREGRAFYLVATRKGGEHRLEVYSPLELEGLFNGRAQQIQPIYSSAFADTMDHLIGTILRNKP